MLHCEDFSAHPFSSVMSNFLQPHGLQHARPPCPSPTPRPCSISCPLSQWCHPTISSSVIPFSSCLQSFPVSGAFLMSQVFASGGQSIEVSTSALALPMNIQDWFPLWLTGLISFSAHKSLQSYAVCNSQNCMITFLYFFFFLKHECVFKSYVLTRTIPLMN